MDKDLIEALYVLLETARISMGASLASMNEGEGPALQNSARAILPKQNAALESLETWQGINTKRIVHVLLEQLRIIMGASLGSIPNEPNAPGSALQADALKILSRLIEIRDKYDV